VSDQDFFFDEDEQPAAEPAKATAKKSSGSTPAAAAPAGASAGVSMTVAALVGVVAVLLGMIVGIFIGRGLAAPAVTPVNTGAPIQGQQAAPQLSPEQLEGGELPQGHPDISGGAGGAATETPAP